MKKLFLIAVLSGILFSGFARQDTIYRKKVFSTARVSLPPQIDGVFDDKAWEVVDWAGEFQMYEPYDDRPPTQETRFKIVYDQENIYLAIRAFDTAPDSIVSRLTRRDETDGDIVAFQFDSYHDLQTGFTFFVSAAGSRTDYYETRDGEMQDFTWDAIWWVKTNIDREGWTAEVKIPFSQLRFDKNSRGIWGLQVAREIYRKQEVSVWQPVSKEAPGWIHLNGELHGLEDIDPKKQAEIAPYVVAGNRWFEKDPDNPFRSTGASGILNAGLDAKVGLTNNFTMDLTVNPDFGQVEADPSQVNLTAFEVFFEEQRPFFIEGKNIFDFDLAVHSMDNLFYSRRIGRKPHHHPDLEEGAYARIPEFTKILGAAKITGKTRNGLSVGIMESVTAREFADIEQNGQHHRESVEPLTNYLAGRVSKEFNKGNTILGGMVTSTHRLGEEEHLDYLHKSALSGGIDFEQYFNDRSYMFSFSSYMSQVNGSEEALIRTQRSPVHFFQRPDADYFALDSTRTSLTGYGGHMGFGKQSGRFRFMGFVYINSPGLELNDLGFLASSDDIMQIFWMGYRFNEPFGVFRNLSLNINQWNVWDFGGNHQLFGTNINGHAQLKNLWNLGMYVDYKTDVLTHSALRGGPSIILPGGNSAGIFLTSNTRKKLVTEIHGFYNRSFDDAGDRISLDLDLTYKPFSNLNFTLAPGYSMRNSKLQFVTQEHFETDDRYIFGNIEQKTFSLSMRINLILSPEMTIQFWGQPFIASGKYDRIKIITDPQADNFTDRFRILEEPEITYLPDELVYRVNEQGTGLRYDFDNPDFKVKEFLSNLVFRWEYRPGSFLYLVWTESRSAYDALGRFRLGNDFSDIWNIHPTDVLMLKISYRIGR